MNPRAKSGHDYQSNYLCKKPNCHRIAHYGWRGLCQHHFDLYQRELLNSGQILGRGRVDAKPVAAHISKLRASGMQVHSIAHYSGVGTATLWRLFRQEKVSADTAARIMRVTTDEMVRTCRLS